MAKSPFRSSGVGSDANAVWANSQFARGAQPWVNHANGPTGANQSERKKKFLVKKNPIQLHLSPLNLSSNNRGIPQLQPPLCLPQPEAFVNRNPLTPRALHFGTLCPSLVPPTTRTRTQMPRLPTQPYLPFRRSLLLGWVFPRQLTRKPPILTSSVVLKDLTLPM